MRRLSALFGTSMLLAACHAPSRPIEDAAASQPAAPQQVQANLPDVRFEQLGDVLIRVKREIYIYQSNALKPSVQATAEHRACGHGDIEFDIKSVKMEFAVESARAVEGGAEAELGVPVFKSVGSAKMAAKLLKQDTGMETLVYYYFPETNHDFAASKDNISPTERQEIDKLRPNATIADALGALRNGLIAAANKYPCFRRPDKDDPDGTIVFKVLLVQEASGKLDIDLLKLVNAGGSIDDKTTGTTTITVSFHRSLDQMAAQR